MENIINIDTFFNELRRNNNAVWFEQETIHLSVEKKKDCSAIADFIKQNKTHILSVLKENQIFTEADFFHSPILKYGDLINYPLSYSQERLWFIENYEEGTSAYHVAAVYELGEDTDMHALTSSLQKIISRHEILRSTIEQNDQLEYAIQKVHTLPLTIHTTTLFRTDDYSTIIKTETKRPFNLSKEYPIRVHFYDIVDPEAQMVQRNMLLINIHHIACDGWSIDLFQKELMVYYEAYIRKDLSFELPSLEIQYKDYALWQRCYLTGETLNKQLEYWRNKLEGYQQLQFPLDYQRPSVVNYKGSTREFTLSKEQSAKVRELAKTHGLTVNSVLLSSVSILLSKYSNQNDIVVGSPVANRYNRQVENSIGFFANTLVNRTLLSDNEDFESLIKRVHDDQIEAQHHQDLPFEKLVNELIVERDTSRNPVFQIYFAVRNHTVAEKVSPVSNTFTILSDATDEKIEKFDLSIVFDDDGHQLSGFIGFAASLFSSDTIVQFIDNYKYLLTLLLNAPQKKYQLHSILNPDEYDKIVYQWNETKTKKTEKQTIYQRFEEQVELTPESTALVYSDCRVSYRTLNKKSNQLARYIRETYKTLTGIELTADKSIALYFDRSPEMIIAMLAVWKAGAAYVPIDPSYPEERINFILDDAKPVLILLQAGTIDINKRSFHLERTICIDQVDLKKYDSENLQVYSQASNLSYIIYTSGTSGTPKGVMIEHGAALNTISALFTVYDNSKIKRATFYTSYVFDVSVSEIFNSLLSGIELHILSGEQRINSQLLSDYFKQNRINLAYLPPVLLGQLPLQDNNDLMYIIYAGEPCNKHIASLWSQKVHLFNYYGPTEASIYATGKRIVENEVELIGRPIQNTKLYVLDKNLQPVSVGIPGELYISGAGLARGYLNKPDLTSRCFIHNPFMKELDTDYSRMYKTGDIVKWRYDGQLEYVGRNDEQVKIRGFRVELAEIENSLLRLKSIKQACIVAKERQTEFGAIKYLIAYYVPEKKSGISQAIIENELKCVLPDYMVPSIWVTLECMPLTINGKLDKRALPEPDYTLTQKYIAPVSEKEQAVCVIWQNALGLEKIGVEDNFFSIGGNSIVAIRISHQMSRTLEQDVKVYDLFKYKTIANLLHNLPTHTAVVIPKTNLKLAPLSFAQERMWFIEQFENGTNAYHIPHLFQVNEAADIDALKFSLQKLFLRHEILRTTYHQNDTYTSAVQTIHDELPLIEEIKLSRLDELTEHIRQEINQPFDLSSEYPIRLKLFHVQSKNRKRLLVNIHHIAADAWSMNIFYNELFKYYQSFITKDTHFDLPEPEINYKDYAIWQRSRFNEALISKQLDFWKKKLTGCQPLELPIDRIRPLLPDYLGAHEKLELGKELSDLLKNIALSNGVTIYSVLLSAFSILLGKYTGQQDIVIGSPVANRHYKQTTNVIGLFINTLVNRILLKKKQTFIELIQQVHSEQMELLSNQDIPFDKIVNALEIPLDRSKHPIFQVTFGMDHDFNEDGLGKEFEQFFQPLAIDDFYEIAKFDLSVVIGEENEQMVCYVNYAKSLFQQQSIAQLIKHYRHLLGQLALQPDRPYSVLNLTSKEHYRKVIYDWNDRFTKFPEEKTLHQLFEEQVMRSPGNIAVEFKENYLTYAELNEKSNRLAVKIREAYEGITKRTFVPDTLIALYLERGIEMIVSILAVLKSGGAYVPIDPSYPKERVNFILEDTKAELVLCQKHSNISYLLRPEKIVYVDLTENFYTLPFTDRPLTQVRSTNLAYVIYTSGTTGKPKGAMVEHKGVINMIVNQNRITGIATHDIGAQFASYVFDASVPEIFSVIFTGAKLCIVPSEIKQDPHQLMNFIEDKQITIADIPPALLSIFPSGKLTSLKTIILGGQSCPQETINLWSQERNLIVAYGPTEASICTTMNKFGTGDLNTKIGVPFNNTLVYILDEQMFPVPIGMEGELYIGGVGIARGYLNHPELTDEKFIPNPFIDERLEKLGYTRIYKTGDRVKWLPDGNIQFIGRDDEQIKINGYRIELGEIENALLQVPGIKQSCAIAIKRASGGMNTKIIAAYCIVDKTIGPAGEIDIHTRLSHLLPEFMLPASITIVDKFPVTTNGKTDKKALAQILTPLKTRNDYLAPNSELELTLSSIFAEILMTEKQQIGIHHNFFRIGGNSILSVQLKNRLRQLDEFKNISVADIFKYNTVHRLIESIKKEATYNVQNIFPENNEEIAIIGISGAFSGVEDIKEFWTIISNQKEGIQFHTHQELDQLDTHLKGTPNFIPVSGQVKDIELFDAKFWELSLQEARLLDPQIRKFIEHCWYALESAGYSNHRKNATIGIFAGSGNSNYLHNHVLNGETAEQINVWEAYNSNSKDALATQTAFLLGLTGPAQSINTACSTGLVSIIEGCKNLRLGTCNMVLAGGVSLSLPDEIGYVYQDGMIMSKDGHCKPFDIDASGTIRGSGVGVVLLKRLKDAIIDKDKIHAVIKGYATNNDGSRRTAYSAPSITGQSECILNAQKMAGIFSHQIHYVECHGTGTILGDPIELKALKEAFDYNTTPEHSSTYTKTILGAVKANIGHTDSAAGVAGLIKVCCMLERDVIPGQANYSNPNTQLTEDLTNFEIITENIPWTKTQYPRLAAVSSFGVGGTNAHLILGDMHSATDGNTFENNNHYQENITYVIPITAKTRESAELFRDKLLKYLLSAKSPICLRDIAYTLQERREQFRYRFAYQATTIKTLIEELQKGIGTEECPENKNKIVFLFPGQGAQYTNMGRDLYEQQPLFKDLVDECLQFANQYTEIPLQEIIFPIGNPVEHNINETKWAQISLFILEYALACYLEKTGISADSYIGHSVGEYVAATLAGVFNLEDAIKLVIARGKLMQSMKRGSMLAIHSDKEKIQDLVSEYQCELAVVNTFKDFVVSGEEEHIDQLKRQLESLEISSIKLHTSHAYHSHMMQEAANKFEQSFKDIQLNYPSKIFISNLTGRIADAEVIRPEYWCRQLRNTVQFSDGVNTISTYYHHKVSFVEVGPGKALSDSIKRYNTVIESPFIRCVQLLPSAKQPHINWNAETIKIGLWQVGIISKPNNIELFETAQLDRNLPCYQFNFQRCWMEKSKTIDPSSRLMFLPKNKWLYAPVWVPYQKLTKKMISSQSSILIDALIFLRSDQINLFEGHLEKNWLVVIDEKEFRQSNHVIGINAKDEQHFKKLAEFLNARLISVKTIIHAASIDNKMEDTDQSLYSSFYLLFHIRQYFIKTLGFENLLVLTNQLAQITNTDSIIPVNGTLVGAIRNISNEFPDINIGLIDIGSYSSHTCSYINEIWNDFILDKKASICAIRFGKLWREQFEQINIGDDTSTNTTLKDGDVILITGGLGGIALSIADYISNRHTVKFILMSQNNIYTQNSSDYILQKKQLISQIKACGSLVDIICVDISDASELKIELDNIQSIRGDITGIIHTAGRSPLNQYHYELEHIKENTKGKINGLMNIITHLDMKKVRFLASTSSLSSVLGDVNRFEYCAANGYLDYLSMDKKELKNTKLITVNWPGWSDIGMIKNNYNPGQDTSHPENKFLQIISHNSVTQQEGAELFYQLISQEKHERVIVSKFDLNVLKDTLFKPKAEEQSKMKTTVIEEASEKEIQIAKIIGNVLGLEKLSVHDDFFKIGGNSLAAIRLISALKKINVKIDLQEILSVNTAHKIYLESQRNQYQEKSIIVPLKLTHSKRNAFFIHAVGGTAIGYMDLCRKLDDSYNYYGIQNINIYGEKIIDVSSIEELADVYVQEILKIQPRGEYLLAGSSLGGTLAFEIARILQEQKGSAVKIFMFDSWAQFSDRFKRRELFISEMNKQQDMYKSDLASLDITERANLLEAQWQLMEMLLSYQPKVSESISAILFKAKTLNEMHASNTPSKSNGWRHYIKSIRVYDIPGDHNTILSGEGMEQICKIITSEMDLATLKKSEFLEN